MNKPQNQLLEIVRKHNREQYRRATMRLQKLEAIESSALTQPQMTKQIREWTAYKIRHSPKITLAIKTVMMAYDEEPDGLKIIKGFCVGLMRLDERFNP